MISLFSGAAVRIFENFLSFRLIYTYNYKSIIVYHIGDSVLIVFLTIHCINRRIRFWKVVYELLFSYYHY